jgi:hypothetical protein
VSFTHLLIVAGPAGAGKSTLMRELSEGRLSPEIVERLPAGAADWPRVIANDIESKGLCPLLRGGKAAGLIVHYNTMRSFSRGYDYDSDPALRMLDATAAPITVATIILPPALLSKQYRARIAEQNEDEWWVAVPPLKAFRRKMLALLRQSFRRPKPPLKPEQLRLMQLYESPDELKQWYDRWKAYLRGRCEHRPHTSAIFVASRPSSQFALMHPTDVLSP